MCQKVHICCSAQTFVKIQVFTSPILAHSFSPLHMKTSKELGVYFNLCVIAAGNEGEV
jgi:hypothetical protein